MSSAHFRCALCNVRHCTPSENRLDTFAVICRPRGDSSWQSEHGSAYYSKKKMIIVFENILLIILENVTKQHYILFGLSEYEIETISIHNIRCQFVTR